MVSVLIIVGTLLPAWTQASILSDFVSFITGKVQADVLSNGNVQTMPLPKPALNIDPAAGRGGGDITIVDSSALVPEDGPSGTIADIVKPKNGMISTYIVRAGDTLSGIATMFGVSPNTVLWANDLPRGSKLKVGQTLTILPVTGVRYVVKKGDTLASIAKKFGGDAAEIARFNGIDNTSLAVGVEIVVPDGEIAALPPSGSAKFGPEPAHNVGPTGTLAQVGYYIAPLSGYIRTQGIHGYNAVDLASPGNPHAPILAAAAGDVVVAKEGGWNGGYGSYIVIQHENGSQTLYGHASRVIVADGQSVVQGQVIGYIGASGKATGPHVHFEIRNGIRNPF